MKILALICIGIILIVYLNILVKEEYEEVYSLGNFISEIVTLLVIFIPMLYILIN